MINNSGTMVEQWLNDSLTIDVDLALIGEKVDRKVVRRLSDDLNEEYPLPYFFDIVNYNDISNEELKKHIESVGKLIYKGRK